MNNLEDNNYFPFTKLTDQEIWTDGCTYLVFSTNLEKPAYNILTKFNRLRIQLEKANEVIKFYADDEYVGRLAREYFEKYK